MTDLDHQRNVQPTAADGDDPSTESANRWANGKWRAALVAIGATVGVAVVTWVVLATQNDGSAALNAEPLNTTTVERVDLVVTDVLDGTLGYGEADQLVFRTSDDGVGTVESVQSGTITWIPQEGSTIAFGSPLFEIDAQPVILLEGDIPAYRVFNSRMTDGPDVELLERALVDLGFDPDGAVTVDEDFTSATADAIERMQAAVGGQATGTLGLGAVVFNETPVYVSDLGVEVGDAVNSRTTIYSTSHVQGGTVTAIASDGSIVQQGGTIVELDGHPTVLITGLVPVTRALTRGVEGLDVEQLQMALVELGFASDDADSVSGVYDTATMGAVASWQQSIGAVPDGVVNVGDIVVSPQPVRVGETLVAVGDPIGSGTPIMTTSVSETVIEVQLSTDDQELVAIGDAVSVELPSGVVVDAEVTDIGSVVLATQQGATYFDMEVTLHDPSAAQGLDQAPVDVILVSDRADAVLAIPVTGLLALAEGGYAVEVLGGDGSTYLVAVDPGLFADGFVAVVGDGLESGMEVVVP